MDKKTIFDLVAKAAAKSPAVKRKVGAIIVCDADNVVEISGYNHNNGGVCEDSVGNTLPTVVHAEVDAINKLAYAKIMDKPGEKLNLVNYTMYVSHQPCIECEAKLKSVNLKYEVVSEFLKFDGDKLRYDLVPYSSTNVLCLHDSGPLRGDELECTFKYFEMYRERNNKEMLLLAFISLSDWIEGSHERIPTASLEALATILTFGARKYKPNNWRNCTELERYDAAFMRHYLAHMSGEDKDSDSGYPHLWHALTCLAFLVELK